MASEVAFCIGEAVPAALGDLSMGISSSAVIDKIKSVGTHSLEPSPWDKRKKVTWQLPVSSHYENVIFLFTVKDRLCLVHFTLRKESKPEIYNLKKAFMDRFGISHQNPERLRRENKDVLVYGGSKPGFLFFEITDVKTGDKAFELYDKTVSSEDNPKKDAENGSDDQK